MVCLLSFFLDELAKGKERLCARCGFVKLLGNIDMRFAKEKLRGIAKEYID